jgi:hypothetical protein
MFGLTVPSRASSASIASIKKSTSSLVQMLPSSPVPVSLWSESYQVRSSAMQE